MVNLTPLIKRHEKTVGSRLTVIGMACSDHMVLAMDEFGRVFGGFDDLLVKFGDTGEQAINCLCDGEPPAHIDTPLRPQRFEDPEPVLTVQVLETLRKAGWDEARLLPSPSQGEKVFDRFLREFGGISFDYTNTVNAKRDTCSLGIPRDISREDLDQWQHDAKQELQPIGQLKASELVLLMGNDGRVYGGMQGLPEFLYLIGESGADALNRLITGSPMLRLV